jgi:putative transposase
MAHTYTSLFYHIVFSTKGRTPWLFDAQKDRMNAYLAATLDKMACHSLLVGAVANHVHLLCSVPPKLAVAKVVQEIKSNSSGWFHEEFRRAAFAWQEGYGAFTVSPPQTGRVIKYIQNRDEHHRMKSFEEEYLGFLKKARIAYDERYVWD